MRIAVDAMGGDHAPEEIVAGAVQAAREFKKLEIVLVGSTNLLSSLFSKNSLPENLSWRDAKEVITMHEPPALALRQKKEASIVVATQLVKLGEADALVSAGSTGAQMAAALLFLGRIKGIHRPAIATLIPTLQGLKVLLDAGANMDCKPQQLLQFAQMGSVYAERILGIPSPRVGLLNVGVEENKGNELTFSAYQLLKSSPLNFAGNVEARDIFEGKTDVIVCDGFVGNIVLKFGEGLAITALKMLKKELGERILAKLGGFLVSSALSDLIKVLDYSEYGGAPLLGVKGISIVCHGSSKAKAIKNAVSMAVSCVEKKFVQQISEAIGV